MTDDRAREEFALNARVHIAALQSALARQLFRRDARNAAVDECVGKLTVAAEMWGDARVLAAARYSGIEADRLRAEMEAERAKNAELMKLSDGPGAPQDPAPTPDPPPTHKRAPRAATAPRRTKPAPKDGA
jgi:hypothetical protein